MQTPYSAELNSGQASSPAHGVGVAKADACPVSLRPQQFGVRNALSALVFSAALGYQSHMSKESIEDLARKLAEAVPQGLKSMRDDLEENFHAVLRSGLSKLDLVTREEFEVQEAVLARTREKLEALEKRIQEMET